MWKRSWGVLVTWQMGQCSLFHPTKVIWFLLSWYLSWMGSKVKKPRFPWGKVKWMKLTIWGKNLEENSSNSSASYCGGGLSSYFLQGLQFGNAFSSLLAEFMVKYAFFCLHLSVCHISLKSRPCQSGSWFLSPSVGLLQHIVHGITLENPPVDLVLCLFTFPSASYCMYSKAELSFLCTGREMEVNWDQRRKPS